MKKFFFALITSFLFVATAWGQCTNMLVGGEDTDILTIGTIGETRELKLSHPVKHISFEAKRSSSGYGSL
jgi:hypothetical protein